MGCGQAKHRQPYDNTRQVHSNEHQDSRRLVRLRDVDERNTQRHSTRELQRVDVIKARRRESEAAISNLPKPSTPEKLPNLKKRMSALMSPERDALKRDLSSLSTSDTSSLASRLAKLGLASHEMRGDGNCQFRALSHELYGSQDHHLRVRAGAVAYLRAHEADFAPFVGTAADWAHYLGRMAKSREWGDELTLQAACGAFAVDVHVISTETEHFHLEYACPVPSAATPRKLFLSYISPIHYNVVVPNK